MKKLLVVFMLGFALVLLSGCDENAASNDLSEASLTKLPIITAENMTVNDLESFDYTSGVSAVDRDGNALNVVVEDTNIPEVIVDGIYYVTYSATDDQERKATKTINVLIDRTKPFFDIDPMIPTHFEIGDALPDWKQFVTVTDNLDGEIDVTDSMISSAVNLYEAGMYVVKFVVKDRANNERTYEHVVTVSDYDAPKIYLSKTAETFELGTTEKPEAYWRNLIVSATDNADDITIDDIEINSQNVNYNEPGVYPVYFRISDSSNNFASSTLLVTIEDNEAPVIELFSPVVTVEADSTNIATLLLNNLLSVTDNADGNITFNNVDLYYDHIDFSVPGEYEAYYAVSDLALNMTIKTVEVTVQDTTNPYITSNVSSNETGLFSLSANELIYAYSVDNGLTWETLDVPTLTEYLTFEELGTYYIKVKDRAGLMSTTHTYQYVDNTKPVIITGSVSSNEGYYSLYATEDIYWYQIGTRNWVQVLEPSQSINIPFDRTGDYQIKVMDRNNNISTAVTYRYVDEVKPTITSLDVTDNTGIYTLTASEIIGAYRIYYVSYGSWQDVSDLYTTSIDIEVSKAGTHIIQVQDLSGNISYNLVSYTYVDETNPVIVSKDSISNINTFMVEANEDIFEYSIDNGFSWTKLDTPNPFAEISVTLEGTYLIKVKDQAGLESEAVSFTFDITAPSVTSYEVSKTDGMLYVEASESIYRYSLNNGTSFTTLSEESDSFSYVLAEEGDYTFDLVIEDYAGNQTAQTITVTYDKTAPVFLSSSQDGSNNYTFVYDEIVTAYSYDLVTWEPLTEPADTFTVALTAGTYQVYVRDAYENVSLAHEVVVE